MFYAAAQIKIVKSSFEQSPGEEGFPSSLDIQEKTTRIQREARRAESDVTISIGESISS